MRRTYLLQIIGKIYDYNKIKGTLAKCQAKIRTRNNLQGGRVGTTVTRKNVYHTLKKIALNKIELLQATLILMANSN